MSAYQKPRIAENTGPGPNSSQFPCTFHFPFLKILEWDRPRQNSLITNWLNLQYGIKMSCINHQGDQIDRKRGMVSPVIDEGCRFPLNRYWKFNQVGKWVSTYRYCDVLLIHISHTHYRHEDMTDCLWNMNWKWGDVIIIKNNESHARIDWLVLMCDF